MKVGLIGEKLGHSFSKEIHERFTKVNYQLMEMNEDEFHRFMKRKDFDFINVTLPYKEKVMQYCDVLDKKATSIHAVNAIKNVNGQLIATNTDFDGLKMMIEKRFNLKDKVVAILGSGGTSKTAYAVCVALQAKKILQIARKKPYLSYLEMKNHQEIQYIINTTSVGMSPHIMDQVIDLDDFQNVEGVIDVIYNPLLTSLCYQAKLKSIPYVNGLEMLVGQAIAAIEFYTDQSIHKALIDDMTKELIHQKQNLVLIGMPGSGKTSFGKKLAKLLNMPHLDIDKEIVKKTGKTIPEIFQDGEDAFRKIESEIVFNLSKRNHTVISCGGGVVKNEKNMQALALNGFIIYLKRDLDYLSTKGRPLSKDRKALEEMILEREPLYLKYSDKIVYNDERFNRTLQELMEVWNENTCTEWS